jgi:Tfp pilus assembly protein PilN
MAKKKNQDINLLPQKEFEESGLGRTLKWLLTTFRYIVISIEMVVMIAFLSRFWLDAKSSELIDAIIQKKAVVASFASFENQFTSVQNKLQVFAKFANEKEKVSPVLVNIASQVPANITITNILIDNSKIEITADTGDENSASNFIRNLNVLPNFENATLTSLASKPSSSLISFTVSANLKERSQNAGVTN